MCVGCRAKAPAPALHRFVRAGGAVVPDPTGTAPGRGAWLHPDPACFELALTRKGFQRAFRGPVTIPPDTLDFSSRWQRSASTS